MTEELSLHSLPFLFTSLISLALSLFVFLKNRLSAVNRSFSLLGLSCFFWQFPYFIGYNITDDLAIFAFYRIAYIGLAFVYPAVYHFIVSFLHLQKRILLSLFYGLAFIFSIAATTSDYIIKGTRKFAYGSMVIPGEGYPLFLGISLIPLLLSLSYLYQAYRGAESPYNKKRIKYFLYTLPIAYLAVIDYLPLQGINIYPFGFIPLIFFAVSTTYAIVRYRLLDIEIIVKKASLIVLGFAASLGIAYAGVSYLQQYFYHILGRNWIIFPLVVALGVGFCLFRFINFVRNIQENELSKKFAYRPILKKEAARISQAKNMNELIAYVCRDLSSWIRLDYVGIFVLDTQSSKFILMRSLRRTEKKIRIARGSVLSKNNPLILYLAREKRPLIHSQIEHFLRTEPLSVEEKEFLRQVARQMEILGFEIAIPSFCEDELLAIINIGNKLNPNEIVTAEDLELLTSLANTFARAVSGFMLQKEKTRLIVASQNIIISTIEAKDSYTRGHTDRVANYTLIIGRRLEQLLRSFSYDLYHLNWSAQLHDVGKIGIPDSILLKTGPLDRQEWQKVKEHPLNGIRIVKPVQEWLGKDICAGILYHHENFDGSGYPSGQKGETIHLFARIIRVADAFDAMTSNRPYRGALSKAEAFQELNEYKGIYFDPFIVEIFTSSQDEIKG